MQLPPEDLIFVAPADEAVTARVHEVRREGEHQGKLIVALVCIWLVSGCLGPYAVFVTPAALCGVFAWGVASERRFRIGGNQFRLQTALIWMLACTVPFCLVRLVRPADQLSAFLFLGPPGLLVGLGMSYLLATIGADFAEVFPRGNGEPRTLAERYRRQECDARMEAWGKEQSAGEAK